MWIYCRYITKNGVRIYPKNKRYFRFWVDDEKAVDENTTDKKLIINRRAGSSPARLLLYVHIWDFIERLMYSAIQQTDENFSRSYI